MRRAAVTLAAAAMVAMAGGECGCGGREEVVRAVLGTLEISWWECVGPLI
jgi:hypothetical protein